MDRRTFLAGAGIALSSVAAGYAFDQTSSARCHLMHEVVESSDDHGEVLETYRYEELSGEARQVFEAAATDGRYATTDRTLNAPEFRYWDETTSYEISYRNETYVLLTYTGEGCENE